MEQNDGVAALWRPFRGPAPNDVPIVDATSSCSGDDNGTQWRKNRDFSEDRTMKTFLTLAICLLAQQIAFSEQKEKDVPIYEGKTLDEWIALTKDKDWMVRGDAAEAIGRIV